MPGASLCCAQRDSVTGSFDKMLLRELLGFCFENLVTVNSRILLLNVKSGVIQSELAGAFDPGFMLFGPVVEHNKPTREIPRRFPSPW